MFKMEVKNECFQIVGGIANPYVRLFLYTLYQ